MKDMLGHLVLLVDAEVQNAGQGGNVSDVCLGMSLCCTSACLCLIGDSDSLTCWDR